MQQTVLSMELLYCQTPQVKQEGSFAFVATDFSLQRGGTAVFQLALMSYWNGPIGEALQGEPPHRGLRGERFTMKIVISHKKEPNEFLCRERQHRASAPRNNKRISMAFLNKVSISSLA